MKNSPKNTAVGESGYLNRNCWLVRNLNYPPYKRCQHCRWRFRNCLFLHYQIISAVLILSFLFLFFLIEGRISALVVIAIFTPVIIYGYYFNRSTENIIEANFAQAKAKESLEELTENLEKKVQEQTKSLQKKNQHLEKLLQMRTEFLDIASHQLKTPISVIRSTLSMFVDGDMDKLPAADKKKFYHNMIVKTEKLHNIISDILRASEMDTEDFRIRYRSAKPLQLEDIMGQVYNDLKEQAEERQIKLELIKPEKKTSPVLTENQFLEQAIYNLVDNAIKYTKKGFVRMALAQDKGRLIVKVKDSGIGIPPADQEKMFDKFSRAKNAVSMYTDGSGLGLFIVKKVIEAHRGGKITFSSRENQGTEFTIYLDAIKKK